MSNISFDNVIQKIVTSNPVDKTAALVTSEGVDAISTRLIRRVHSPFPLPMRSSQHLLAKDNLTGVNFGLFQVVGLYALKKGNKGNCKNRWVVRCCCGNYEIRKPKSIKNQSNYSDACDECLHIEYLRGKI